ncbi:hypothetical protein SUGI_0069320 [Cryptomeria japonica]|nr:hypothetical protein SUGI_0069320 [Cryptomeria japonica]
MDVDEKEATLLAVEIAAHKGDNVVEREDESILGCFFIALYYVAPRAVPFGCESEPRTPKRCLNLGEEKLPAALLTPSPSLHMARSRSKPYLPNSLLDPIETFSSMFGSYVSMGKISERTFLVMMKEDQNIRTYGPQQIPDLLALKSQLVEQQNIAKTEIPRVPLDSPLASQCYGDILAGKNLAYLEEALHKKSGNPDAHLADYVDVAIATGVGGLIA